MTAVAEWLGKMGFWFKSGEGLEMQERLFALPNTAIRMPEAGCDWLPSVGLLGLKPRPSPLVAYRLGLIRDRFRRDPWPTMNELLALASAGPGKVRMLRVVRQASPNQGAIQIFRQTATNASRGCYWLHWQLDGMPRFYKPEDIEAWSRLPPNQGHITRWLPRRGPNHEGCRCSDWTTWIPAMSGIFEPRTVERVAIMRQLGLHRLQAVMSLRRR